MVTIDASGDGSFYRMTRWPLRVFQAAIATRQAVRFPGYQINIDSFDSSNPLYSTNGLYYAPFRKAGGNVACAGNINITNANIYGKVLTAPYGQSTLVNGLVGDLTWPGGIEPGWWVNNYKFCLPDIAAPFTSGFPIGPTFSSSTNTYYLPSGNYLVAGDFSPTNGETVYVVGTVALYVTGNFTMTGQNGSTLTIAPGGNLRLYVGTTNASGVSSVLTH